MGKEQGAVIGAIAVIGTITGILSDGFGIASHFDKNNSDNNGASNNVNVYVSVDGQNNVSVDTNNSSSEEISTSSEIAAENADVNENVTENITAALPTEPQTEAVSVHTVTVPSEINPDREFKVTDIWTLSQKIENYDVGTSFIEKDIMQYNSNDNILYYLDGENAIRSFNFSTNTDELVIKTDKAQIKYLAFNKYSNTLYAYVQGNDDAGIFDITHNKMALGLENSSFCGSVAGEKITFSDADTLILLPDETRSFEVYSLSTGDLKKSMNGFMEQSFRLTCCSPFFSDGHCWYWAYSGYYDTKSAVVRTNQLLSQEYDCYEEIANNNIINCYCTSDNGLYYMTNDKSIYLYDVSGTHQSETVLSDAVTADIPVVYGSSIENSATAYISSDISYLCYINDSCFVLYDHQDNKLKMLSAD